MSMDLSREHGREHGGARRKMSVARTPLELRARDLAIAGPYLYSTRMNAC